MLSFRGGVHPRGGKKLSSDNKIVRLLPTKDLVYPLSQHIGAPATALVKKGDRVLQGQMIAKAGGFVSANIHSSVSGTVKNIESRLVAGQNKVLSIVVENDGLYESVDYEALKKDVNSLSPKEIIDAVAEAGIVGLGGATFPTHVKLSVKEPDSIDYVLVNGAECEPYLNSDYRRMIEEPETIVKGLDAVLRIFPKAKGIIAIEDNKPEAIKAMKACVSGYDRISVETVKTKYPQGGERFLIYALTKREINSKMLPADAGCVVQNVDTMHAVYDALYNGRPLIERLVTITGETVNKPQVYSVLLGTDLSELVDASEGFNCEPGKIICGGPMMGIAMADYHVPVAKGVSALLALKEDEVPEEESACIRCGRCAEVCPGHVQPFKLAELARKNMMDEFVQNNGLECCECGCCSYICPAKRPLTHRIKTMRKTALAAKKK
ncbi:MAG TPA: electron transport complex subunit RsxC [Eubacterium sp.]|nr:electron transport complex subunit RsxC [Eubacterium sp.]